MPQRALPARMRAAASSWEIRTELATLTSASASPWRRYNESNALALRARRSSCSCDTCARVGGRSAPLRASFTRCVDSARLQHLRSRLRFRQPRGGALSRLLAARGELRCQLCCAARDWTSGFCAAVCCAWAGARDGAA
jgi:hypothetical protein